MHKGKVSQSKSSAPGQYLGFALQPVRLCYYLLNSPDDANVSLEYYDDVAVHYADGRVLLEQTKSALTHNPLSDWSEDFWKTVSNWIDILTEHNIPHNKVTFRYYVTPTKRIGKLCTLFHEAKSSTDTTSLIAQLHKELKKLKSEPGCIKYISRFLGATRKEQETIATQMVIENDEIDPINTIRNCLKSTIADDLIELTCQYAIGMAKENADICIRSKLNAIISVEKFRRKFLIFVQKNNIPGFLPQLNSDVNKSDAEVVLLQRPTFIKQLQLVELREERQLRAISDLLRTDANITTWAEHGLIFERNILEWHNSLIRQYDAIYDDVEETLCDKTSIARGKITYSRCSATHVSFDHHVVPEYFTNGGFNLLADDLRLGWHPDYLQLLNKDDE
ncbi:ABC-three component system protein [Serratia quinivorans]|uniref:ABC-three component system protein n=1 Tax=Serratia quinivorans TaxID=137545 RepID=UPI001C44C450|nr:ABC-three component system protein [Serratia quinivorans]MBV6690548.1 hypothetical protein [Serratia quinivorans]